MKEINENNIEEFNKYDESFKNDNEKKKNFYHLKIIIQTIIIIIKEWIFLKIYLLE